MSFCKAPSWEGLAELTTLLKQSIDAWTHFDIQASEFQNAHIAKHHRANNEVQLGRKEAKAMREEMRQFREASECTQISLLEILGQGLLWFPLILLVIIILLLVLLKNTTWFLTSIYYHKWSNFLELFIHYADLRIWVLHHYNYEWLPL